jgi:hypothetical protein
MSASAPRRRADLLLPLAMVFPTLGAWLYFVQLEGTELAKPTYFVSKVLQLGIPLAWILLTRQRPSRLLGRTGIGSGLAYGAVFAAGVLGAWHWVLRGTELSAQATQRIEVKIADFGISTPLSYLGMALGLSLVHSLFEEFYWRWFVYGRLTLYLPVPVAAVLGALAFTSHHVIVLAAYAPPGSFWTHAVPGAAAVLLGGILWSYLFQRHQNLTSPWVSHILVDLALMGTGALMVFG